MKKIIALLLVMFSVAGIVSMQSCQSTKSSTASKMLKFNFEKGKGYDYDMVWDLDTKVAGQVSKISIDGSYSMRITEDDGTVKSVSTSYKSLKMKMEVGGMNFEIDSDKAAGAGSDMEKDPMGAMGKIFSSLVNKPFIIKVDAEGKVLEVSGFEKIINDMIDSLPGDESVKEQARASMKDQFNEQSIKDNFAQVFTIFPNKEVKVGDSWEKSYNTGGKMGAKFTSNYTVKDIDGDHVTLSTDTKISPTGSDSEVEGKQTGTILVDSKTGLMINASFDQDMKVKSQGTTVDVTGKGKIKGKAL